MIGILHCFSTCWISHTGLVIKGHVKRSTCVGMSSVPPYYEKDGKVHFLIRGISPHQWNKKTYLEVLKFMNISMCVAGKIENMHTKF